MNDVSLMDMKKFFLGANTPLGFVSYFDQIGEYKEGWNRFLIKGGPGTGKSSLMKSIAIKFKELTDDIELIYCSSDPDSLDGVIFNNKKISIVDATPPHVLEPVFPGAFENTISICDCWDNIVLNKNREEVINLFNENLFYHKQAVNILLSAYGIIKNNYDIIDRYIDEDNIEDYIKEIIDENFKFLKEGNKWKEQKRFLSAVSAGEFVFYQDTIKKICDKIYIIDDPYGAVANKILNKIRNKLLNSEIDIITCYCSIFGGKKIDHILIPSLKIAFITSNNYHNFTGNCLKVTDHNNFLKYIPQNLEDQIKFNEDESKKIINQVKVCLKKAKEIHDKLERCYIEAINFKLVDEKRDNTINMIKTLLNK